MGRKLKTDIPGLDWRVCLDDACARGLRQIFEPQIREPERLVVEIGFGRGEFLLDLARRQPRAAFLGVELSFKRVLKMARRLAKQEIENVRLIEARAERVLAELLPPSSVDEFWVNFPDPWPKKRHSRRRLIQPDTVARFASRLVPGCDLHIATDDVAYAEQIHECLSSEHRLENVCGPSRWLPEVPDRVPTAYELEWRAEGRSLHFFRYRRRLLTP